MLLWSEVNPFGPVHEYELIPVGPPIRSNGAATQTGLLFAAVTDGRGRTVAVVVVVFWQPKLFVTTRV